METNQTITGIVYPDITIAGKTYKLKFTLASQFLLQRWGIDEPDLHKWMTEKGKSGQMQDAVLTMVASMVGTFDKRGDWIPLANEPMTLAAKMLPGEWVAIMESLNEAMAKVPPTAAQPDATPATPTQPVQ